MKPLSLQENSLPEAVEYLECDGSIHFSGVVSSSVFMCPKATISEAITAVKQDIIRSLASRFTMHCDALIDDNLLPEGEWRNFSQTKAMKRENRKVGYLIC